MGEPIHRTTREIVSRYYRDDVLWHTGTDAIPASGDIDLTDTPDEAARASADALERVHALLKDAEPSLGWDAYLRLEDAVNALDGAVRSEAISRMVAAAYAMRGFAVAAFVPAIAGDEDKASDSDQDQDQEEVQS